MNNTDMPRLLSFLYNVINVKVLNDQFQHDPASVMNLFALSPDEQAAITQYNDNNEDALLKLLRAELIAERDKFW